MKINILFIQALLLLPLTAPANLFCMDEPESTSSSSDSANLFEKSIIVPMPKEEGLGLTSWFWDKALGEEKNVLTALQGKQFDPGQGGWRRKLDKAVIIYSVTKPNDVALTEMVDICATTHINQIHLDEKSARPGHKFLAVKNKEKQEALKSNLIEEDKLFIAQQNEKLTALQKYVEAQRLELQTRLDNYTKARATIIEERCKDIRRVKRGLVQIHVLCPHKDKAFKADGYCSDDETNPDNVEKSYDNDKILKKIEIDQSLLHTTSEMQRTITALSRLNMAIQNIEQIQYK